MKKTFAIVGAFTLFIAVGAVVSMQNNNLDPESLVARNIEALGGGELGQEGTPGTCSFGIRFINGD